MTLLVYITVPDKKNAHALADMLVAEKLAAGVNLLRGVRSVYRWQGSVRESREYLLLAQVSRAAFENFCQAVRKHHPHEVPCIVALPIETGFTPFLDWIRENSLPSG
ncbi:MAG: divalent ion tolerance protein CutA [Candidatus Desulfovibrio kirbyi]|uniref:Divalent ion tolerance protein CutA n=1 Tax=Candidatus Desulfovibrio kirbyi TaxID=2696086 RepID=A0A6L2R6P4_9BACT|nr:MAG: divalent ion tolerance protein CutA [Candidatus Desulfovibrio kirbyi]